VLPGEVLVLSGSTRVQRLLLADLISGGESATIAAASTADPYLLLHLSNGTAVLLLADPSEGISLLAFLPKAPSPDPTHG
jgi:hypothetical protein